MQRSPKFLLLQRGRACCQEAPFSGQYGTRILGRMQAHLRQAPLDVLGCQKTAFGNCRGKTCVRSLRFAGACGQLESQRTQEVGADRNRVTDPAENVEGKESAHSRLQRFTVLFLDPAQIVVIEKITTAGGCREREDATLLRHNHALQRGIHAQQLAHFPV